MFKGPMDALAGLAIFFFSEVAAIVGTLLLSRWLIIVALALAPWLVRAIRLAVTYFLRADDGHPLLAPLAAPLVSLGGVALNLFSSDLAGVAKTTSVLLSLGGAVILAGLSVYAILRLRRRYPRDFPFRDGPISPAAPTVEKALGLTQ
jgi:hypothetical protein